MSSTLIDKIIKQLQIPQKPWNLSTSQKPNLTHFPIEFNYLTRCLHRLGDNFKDFKIMDLLQPSFGYAILYCIKGNDVSSKLINLDFDLKNNGDFQKICDSLGINVLIIGPDEEQITSWITKKSISPHPYVILFHSYDNLYYPIISLKNQEDYVFYRKNNKILQEYLPKSET